VTGNGPYEDSRPSYQLSGCSGPRGIRHSVDDWGPDGGHDWPYWKRQLDEYIGRLY
jgi:S-formylglutathione hydrolase FrmB